MSLIGSSIRKEGYLIKRGHVVKNWKNRWFVLTETQMSYHTSVGESPKGIIPIASGVTKVFTVDKSISGKDFCFEIQTPEKSYLISATSEIERQSWVTAITQLLQTQSNLPTIQISYSPSSSSGSNSSNSNGTIPSPTTLREAKSTKETQETKMRFNSDLLESFAITVPPRPVAKEFVISSDSPLENIIFQHTEILKKDTFSSYLLYYARFPEQDIEKITEFLASFTEDQVTREIFWKFLQWFPLDRFRDNLRYEYFVASVTRVDSRVLDKKSSSEVASLILAPWFHGFISSTEAEKRMRESPVGSFLVRFSESTPGSFGVALKETSNILHWKLVSCSSPDGFTCYKRHYPSISNFLYVHSQFPIRDSSVTFTSPVDKGSLGDFYAFFQGGIANLIDADSSEGWDKKGAFSTLMLMENGVVHYREILERLNHAWEFLGNTDISTIQNAYLIRNDAIRSSFERFKSKMEWRMLNFPELFMNQDWKNDSSCKERESIMNYFNLRVDTLKYPHSDRVKFIPAIKIVSSLDDAWTIFNSNLDALSFFQRGWYGSGIYLSTSIEHAVSLDMVEPSTTVYAIIFFVLVGNVYPCVESPDGKNSLKGKKLKTGYDSHYCLVNSNQKPASPGEADVLNEEIVVDQISQLLPWMLIELAPPN